jgi:hypothetical protein
MDYGKMSGFAWKPPAAMGAYMLRSGVVDKLINHGFCYQHRIIIIDGTKRLVLSPFPSFAPHPTWLFYFCQAKMKAWSAIVPQVQVDAFFSFF